jgi:hypothetical protein
MTAAMTISEPDKDGVKKASCTYGRITQDMTAGPVNMRYDSDDANTASSPMGAAMKGLVGAKITYEILPDGNVRNVKGMDEIWDAMAKENPAMAATAEQMKKEFGTDQIQSLMMANSAGYLPKDPVAVGSVWRSSVSIKAPVIGAMVMDANCSLASVKDKTATIDFDQKGKIDKPTDTKVGANNMTVQKMDMTQKGRLTFDLARSMIAGVSMKGDVSMDMTMDGPGGQKASISTKQDTQTDITFMPTAASAPAK